jgi:hypothetical protein
MLNDEYMIKWCIFASINYVLRLYSHKIRHDSFLRWRC